MSTFLSNWSVALVQARAGRQRRRVQDHHVEQALPELPSDQDESGVCARLVGRPAAGARVPAQPKPGAGQHTKR